MQLKLTTAFYELACAVGAPEWYSAVVGAVAVEVGGAVEEARARPALVREVGLRSVAGLIL